MTTGPAAVVPAPPLLAPLNGLIVAASVLTGEGGDEVTDERWENGLQFVPEQCGPASVFDPCNPGVLGSARNRGSNRSYDPFIVDAWDTCATFGFEVDDYVGRARRALMAKEEKAVSSEFWHGALKSTNPHLGSGLGRTVTDGVLNSTTTVTSATAAFVAGDVGSKIVGVGIPANTTIAAVNSGTSITISNSATATASGVTLTVTALAQVTQLAAGAAYGRRLGLAALVQAIADGDVGQGMIHASPALVQMWQGDQLLLPDGRLLRTIDGSVVVPGQGYDGAGPDGTLDGTGATQWAYVTDVVQLERGPLITVPDPAETDSMTHATSHTTNTVTYHAYRAWAVKWNQCLHVGAKITMGTP